MNHDLPPLVSSALKNAEENGDGDRLRNMSLVLQAQDLLDCDAEIEGHLFDDVVAAVIDIRLAEKGQFATILNQVQYEGLTHRLLDPVHAIQFALQADEGLDFLRSWNQGDWKMCGYCWPEWKEFRP